MTKPKEHHARKQKESPAGLNGRAGPAAAGMQSYREEYEPDIGPDLDEPLDSTESGREP